MDPMVQAEVIRAAPLFVEKLATPLLVCLLALLGGYRLERYKRSQAVMGELAKMRSGAFVRIFSKMLEFEMVLKELRPFLEKAHASCPAPRAPESYKPSDPRHHDTQVRETLENLERLFRRGELLTDEDRSAMIAKHAEGARLQEELGALTSKDMLLLGKEAVELALRYHAALVNMLPGIPTAGEKLTTNEDLYRFHEEIESYLPPLEKR